ncbi:MAG TPA: toll/interleukin-1 receptor domain-containing protein, partial [Ktedonobacterales bacterium]|nr:toll/interleukin-1 receptor domain-containing protein [Ktedonobacterales bacterium]
MPKTPLRLFISYSRTDSAFVDRLEADLKARSFQPWVDRRKLVAAAGLDWSAELQKAIEECQITLVVLSPKAVESKFVRREYLHADRRGKLIIPLNLLPTDVPFELNELQW